LTSATLRRCVSVLLAALALAVVGQAAPQPGPDGPCALAADCEKRGDWLGACRHYDEALRRDRGLAEAKAGYQRCLRLWHLERRHRDPLYRDAVASLDPNDALAAYVQVLGVVSAAYYDRQKVDLATLFRHGVQELRFALDDPLFVREYLPGATPEAVFAFKARLDAWPSRPLNSREEARKQAEAVTRVAQVCNVPFRPELITVCAFELAAGACNALDEYSLFLTPGALLDGSSRPRLAGVGVEVALVEQRLELSRVYPKGPGEEVGLQPRDRLLRIDRQPVEMMPVEVVAERLLGAPGSEVELEVLSAGQTMPHSVRLTRRHVAVPTVDFRVLDDMMGPDYVGYIRIYGFQDGTLQEVKEALAQLQTVGVKGLILDLRGNPGGVFDVGVQVAELFLPEGTVVAYAQGPLRRYNRPFPVEGGAPCTLPLAVLVDGETASAAEVLAGALKELNRARLLGQTTFGKGTIQCLVPLSKPPLTKLPGGVRLTVARFTLPGKQPVQGLGVAPHDALDADGEALINAARQHLLALTRMMLR
jgi:carboxyl-terminal processing protease